MNALSSNTAPAPNIDLAPRLSMRHGVTYLIDHTNTFRIDLIIPYGEDEIENFLASLSVEDREDCLVALSRRSDEKNGESKSNTFNTL